MSAIRHIRMLTRYSAWANDRLYRALAGLPASVIESDRPGRPNSLARMLSHAYAVDLIWKSNLAGVDHGFKTRNLDETLPLAELAARQRVIDDWYIDCADAQTEQALDEPIDFTFVGGGSGRMTRGEILLHVVNHKTYHRGYVADMLYESGLKPPTLDLPVFLRDAPPSL